MKTDMLRRDKYINQLINIIECISEKNGNYCFAIDGKWGIGKTYILELLENKLEKIQSEATADDKYFVFHYNCWKYDYYEEAAIAIISAMLDRLEQEERVFGKTADDFAKSAWGKAKDIIGDIAGEFSKNKIGINIVETVRDINDKTKKRNEQKYEFDEMYSFRRTLDKTRDKIGELAKIKSIVFIVDELDRCLPEYAIKVMERLHHLFDGINNVTVILSVDSSQLNHSVQQIYGSEVDVDKYLKKFIDFTLILDKGEISENFMREYSEYFECFRDVAEGEKELFIEFFETMFDGIDIRAQKKIMAKAKLIHGLVCRTNKYDLSLLCAEIAYSILSFIIKSEGVVHIIQSIAIEDEYTPNERMEIGNKRADYLSNKNKFFIGTTKDASLNRKFHALRVNFIGKMAWILNGIYEKIDGNFCGSLYMRLENQPQIELEKAKEFVRISQIMV